MKKSILILIAFIFGFHSLINAQVGIACATCDKSKPEIRKETTPMPEFTLNGNRGGKIDSSEIAKWDVMMVTTTNSTNDFYSKFQVEGYQCLIQTKEGAKLFSNSGSKMNSDIVDYAMHCKKGNLIIFYDIRISDGKESKKIQSGPVFRVQ